METRQEQPAPHSSTGHFVRSIPSSQLWLTQPSSASSVSRPQLFGRPLDEPTLAQRTAAFRQLNRLPQQAPRIRHQSTSVGSRSFIPSQPVVVRTYSAGTDARGVMSRQSRSDRRPSAKLPSVQDFGIEGILRAIEPDIRSTLDTIAEICGRSKLSLANEYGSHRPPLGEIRAPAGGLLAVEEASSSNERLVNDDVLIVGDDTSTIDGRDSYLLRYGFQDSMQHNIGALDYRSGFVSLDENGPRRTAPGANQILTGHQMLLPQSRERQLKPKPTSFPWAFLGSNTRNRGSPRRQPLQTQPVTSESHFDAHAGSTIRQSHFTGCDNFRSTQSEPRHVHDPDINKSVNGSIQGKSLILSELRGLLAWVRQVRQRKGATDGNDIYMSAERKLREVLQRHNTNQ